MLEKFLKRSSWTDIVISIIFLLFGVLLIVKPNETLDAVSVILGIVFISMGVLKLVEYYTSDTKEDYLLTGSLEQTSEAYSLAKIATIKLCHYFNVQYGTNFITIMPPNQYGTGDNFNLQTAHLLPMLVRRFHLAKLLKQKDFEGLKKDLSSNKLGWNIDENINFSDNQSIINACAKVGAFADKVIVWGDGSVYRELMNSDDLADICLTLMNRVNASDIGEFLNVGIGEDIQLKDLFKIIAEITGFDGKIEFDVSKPSGVFRKLLDNSKMQKLGLTTERSLKEGLQEFYFWYLNNQKRI